MDHLISPAAAHGARQPGEDAVARPDDVKPAEWLVALGLRSNINIIAAAAVILILAVLLARPVGTIGGDFHVFYLAGERLRAGVSLYQQSDGWFPFKYHPAWATLFSAFTPIPEGRAYLVFNAGQVACWIYAAVIWVRWLGYPTNNFVALFLALAFAANMLSIELRLGQVNGFLLLGATKVVDWMEREQPRWFLASVTAALLTTLKLNFGLLAIYCLIKDTRAGIGFVSVAALFHVVMLVNGAGGSELYREWVTLLLAQSSEQYLSFDAQGIFRLLYATLGNPGGKIAWLGLVVVFVAGGLWLKQRSASHTDIAAYWIGGTYLLSPLAWWYQALFMFPMIAILLHIQLARWERWYVLGCALVMAIVGSDLFGHSGFDGFKTFYGVLIMLLGIFAIFVRHRMLVGTSGAM